MIHTFAFLSVTVLLLVLQPSAAWAYLDPGSGSMLLQVLLGGIAGAVVLVRIYWRRLLTALGLRKEPETLEPGAREATRAAPERKPD